MSFLKAKVVCPHCNRESANHQVCTNRGCGKRIAAPVRLFARNRIPPVLGNMGRSAPRSREGGEPKPVR
jgi:hypothetical protein